MNASETEFRLATTMALSTNDSQRLELSRHGNAKMKTNRRSFLARAGMGLGALGLLENVLPAAETGNPALSFARPSKFHLGTVTYNLAQDWDVPTIIKNCTAARFEGVELRTSHKHGVEVSL